MIKLYFTTLDGIRKTKTFKSLKGARKAAHDWVGADADIGTGYAISTDGVVRVTCDGCTLNDLFGAAMAKKTEEKFMAIRDGRTYKLYCGTVCPMNLFAVAYQAYDNVTGDTYQGWTLKGIGYGYEDWMDGSRRFTTLQYALGAARETFAAYWKYCGEEAEAERRAGC